VLKTQSIVSSLQRYRDKTVYRFDYTESNIQWADAVVTTGGDGTYLLGFKILDRNKPLIGFTQIQQDQKDSCAFKNTLWNIC
ncbi:NAD kinase 2-like 2, partial [Homarus americanus]